MTYGRADKITDALLVAAFVIVFVTTGSWWAFVACLALGYDFGMHWATFDIKVYRFDNGYHVWRLFLRHEWEGLTTEQKIFRVLNPGKNRK